MSQIFFSDLSSSRALIDLLHNGLGDPRQIFCSTYGCGLRFLIERACSGDAAAQCFDTVVGGSIAAILRGDVQRDAEIPGVIRENLHRTLSALDGSTPSLRRLTPSKYTKLLLTRMEKIHPDFSIFTLLQREALYRFYIDNELASSICQALDLNVERFDFIRLVARESVRLNLAVLVL